MCFGGMPAMPAMPEVPKVIDQTQARQNATSATTRSKTAQEAMAADPGTMLTQGVGVDPNTLPLGKKTLLGG
jgi:hypothetical protein